MNLKTKDAKILFPIFLLSAALSSAYADTHLKVYSASYGNVVIYSDNQRRDVYAVGGAVPNGASTSADCFIRAEVNLVQAPDVYSGNLDPVSNRVIIASASTVSGKKLFIQLMGDKVLIQRADTNGMCADGIDFTGRYKKYRLGTEFLKMASRNC